MPHSKVYPTSRSTMSRTLARSTPKKDVDVDSVKNSRISISFFRQLVSRNKNIHRNQKRKQTDVRGAYYVVPCQNGGDNQCSHRTLRTRSNSQESDNSNGPFDTDRDVEHSFPLWTPSNARDHHKDAPLIVRRPQYNELFNEEDDSKLLRKVLYKSRKLPQTSGRGYASNHIMINSERTRRFVAPLMRNPKLDEVAREHAALMAQWNEVYHVRDPQSVYDRIHFDGCHDDDADNHCTLDGNGSSLPPLAVESCRRLGENVACGRNLNDIHLAMLDSLPERNNILDRRFVSMGVGTAVAKDGKIYLCQIFTG